VHRPAGIGSGRASQNTCWSHCKKRFRDPTLRSRRLVSAGAAILRRKQPVRPIADKTVYLVPACFDVWAWGRRSRLGRLLRCEAKAPLARHLPMPKAKLMARVGEEFPLQCPACGGDIRLISFITEPGPIHATAAGRSRPTSNRRFASRRRPGARRPRRLSGTDKRAARDRHPQPLTGAGREVTTKPPGGRTRRDSKPTAKKPHQGGRRAIRKPLSGPRQAREAGATGARLVHQSGNACGSAIDRAIPYPFPPRGGEATAK